jgi:hypothetical protein
MEGMPPRPRGSKCQERVSPDGLTITWRYPAPDRQRFISAAFLGIWLCIWAFGWVAGVVGLLRMGEPLLVLWLAFWTFAGLVTGGIFRLLIEPGRPEAITLGAETFQYDPGTSPEADRVAAGERPLAEMRSYRELFRRRQPVTAARSSVTGFHLERVGNRQRLFCDVGNERAEIGEDLQDRDREWLHAVLERWRTGELWQSISRYQTLYPG